MEIVERLRKIIDSERAQLTTEGTILEIRLFPSSDATLQTITFRLDSHPDVEFRQYVSPLSPRLKPGARVRVLYQQTSAFAAVDWVEKI